MIRMQINPQYKDIERLIGAIPETFETSGIVDYKSRNIIKILDVNGILLNIKSFKKPHSINRFIYSTFRKSKARRSFEYANKLIQNNINTPTPIAYIEEKNGLLLNRSFYISLHEKTDGSMREFRTGKLSGRETLLACFAQFTARLHNKEILHLDYSPGNILYKKNGDGYAFFLVDLNRMTFDKKVTLRQGCHNLRKLFGNKEMISYIAREYAMERQMDTEECIGATLKYHDAFWTRFQKKHSRTFIPPYVND